MRKCLLTLAMIAGLVPAAPAYAGDGGQFLGMIVGAGLGGLIGNQFGHGAGRDAFTAGGVILGGAIGGGIGASMDNGSNTTVYTGSPYYAPYYYQQPVYQMGYAPPTYVAPPEPPSAVAYYDQNVETYCREYNQQIRVGDQIQESYGTACLQPDGSWRVSQ